MKKVVIVEKIKTIREGIKILINQFSEHECIETFENFVDFKNKIDIITPDILLIDIEYKGIPILEEIRYLKSKFPNLCIILLTMNEENEMLFNALSMGAVAYVHKNAPSQKLVRVLDDTVTGKTLINSLIARNTVKYINEKKMLDKYQANELKLLQMVTEGNNLFAIEKSLNMTTDEIKINFRKIYEKIFERSKVLI